MPNIKTLFVVGLLCCPLAAQFENAELTGVVTDSTGAVLPQARLTLTNDATGVQLTTQPNEAGVYLFLALRAGRYTLAAEHPGFRKFTQTGVEISVNQRGRVNLQLTPGEVTEQITVEADALLLETDTMGRGQVVNGRTGRELPLVNRDYQRLALLAPGVTPGTGLSGAIVVNGNRWQNNNWLLDGVDNNVVANNTRGGTTFIQPPVDAIEEFKLQTSAYSAEFGRGAGATFNATIKSGNNQLHGSGWEFFRDSAMNAKNALTQAAILPFRQHQYGGTIGGPIRRNRLFYFADYEGLRNRNTVVRLGNVPNPERFIRQGNQLVGYDFTGLRPVFHPITRQSLPARVTVADGLDPRALRLLALYPAPTRANAEVNPNYEFNPQHTVRDDRFDTRIDYALSQRNRIFGRFSFQDSFAKNSGFLPGLAEGGAGSANSNFDQRSYQVAAGLTTVLSSGKVNELRFGWSQVRDARIPLNPDSGPASQLTGIPGLPSSPLIDGGLPIFSITNFTGLGRGGFANQFQEPTVFTVKDTFAWLIGKHSLKFGGEVRDTANVYFDIRALLGGFTFNGQRTRNAANAATTGDPLADFLFFTPFSASLSAPGLFNHGSLYWYGFVQDDWRVNSKLTLNLGFRYEFARPLTEVENRYANFDPALRNGRGGVRVASDGSIDDRALVLWGPGKAAPRIGVAYQWNKRLVLRGGYGLFVNMEDRRGSESVLSGNPPFAADGSYSFNATPQIQTVDQVVTFLGGILNNLPRTTEGLSNAGFPFWGGILLRTQERDQKIPYSQQWNFTLQYEPFKNTLFEAGYVGNRGLNLSSFRNRNQQTVSGRNDSRPFPDFGDIQWLEMRGVSDYHSLQMRVDKRFSLGFSALASYTWSKFISNSPGALARGATESPQDSFNLAAERGLDPNDIQHNLNIASNWSLPFGRNRQWGRDWNRAVDLLLGGWQLSGIANFRSGFPLHITVRGADAVPLGAIRTQRPDFVPGAVAALPSAERSTARWFNTAAYSRPSGAFGTCPTMCGQLTGPGFNSVDALLAKNFRLTERVQLQLRSEFFNLLNTTQYSNPVTALGEPTFGRILTSYGERQLQLAIKVLF